VKTRKQGKECVRETTTSTLKGGELSQVQPPSNFFGGEEEWVGALVQKKDAIKGPPTRRVFAPK